MLGEVLQFCNEPCRMKVIGRSVVNLGGQRHRHRPSARRYLPIVKIGKRSGLFLVG